MDELQVGERLERDREKLVNIMSEFDSIWHGCLGQMSSKNHKVELSLNGSHQIHHTPYRARPEALELQQSKIENMPAMKVYSLHRKNGQRQSCALQKKKSHHDLHPLQWMKHCDHTRLIYITGFGWGYWFSSNPAIISTFNVKSGYWDMIKLTKTETRRSLHHITDFLVCADAVSTTGCNLDASTGSGGHFVTPEVTIRTGQLWTCRHPLFNPGTTYCARQISTKSTETEKC